MNKYVMTKNVIGLRRRYFVEQIEPALAQARKQSASSTVWYRIADRIMCVTFLSDEMMQRMTPALATRVIDPQERADVYLTVWDSVQTKTPLLKPWENHAYIFEPETQAHQSLDVDFRGVYLQGEKTIQCYDTATQRGYLWVYDARELPQWVVGAPFRTLLHWFLEKYNIQLMHGAVVGTSEGGVLLTAKGGSGKSTTALSCVRAGMHYVGDDYVAAGEQGGLVTAYSLYASLKIHKEQRIFFPELSAGVVSGDKAEEKDLIMLDRVFPERSVASLPLRAICIPVITGGETRLMPVSHTAAFLALAPTTLFQLPLASSDAVMRLRRLVESVPCYRLELGPDLERAPQVLRAYLQTALLKAY